MKKTLLAILMMATNLLTNAQITENPSVSSQKNRDIIVSSVFTNTLLTCVILDYQKYFLNMGKNGIKISPETYIQYEDPLTGNLVREKLIMIERLINNQNKFVASETGKKYDFFTDFGNNSVYVAFRLFFPPIREGVTNFSIDENKGKRGLYWNNIQIKPVEHERNFEEREIITEVFD